MLPVLAAQTGSPLILSNTVLGLAASVALLLLVPFARHGARARRSVRQAWAYCFGGLALILITVGIHTTVAWPLLGPANLIFGEPSLVFGCLLLAAALVIHQTPIKNSSRPDESERFSRANPFGVSGVETFPDELCIALRPIAYAGAFTGPMLILLAAGGAAFGKWVFRPPPNEFPTGIIAGTGIEIVYFLLTYGLLGLGAMLLPVGLHNKSWLRPAAYLLVISGILLLIVTYASFMGHVSLSSGVPPGGIPWPPK